MSYVKASLLSSTTQVSLMITMLIRNVIFARLLSPNDFTIAMTFGIVLLFFEFISNFGHENLMQRSKNGNTVEFQSTVHSTLIIRGIIVALLVMVSAPYISLLIGVSRDTFNFAYLAIIPLCQGLLHTDHIRRHRDHNYYNSAKISILSDISSLFVALACVLLFNNYWGFFISFIYRQSIGVIFSHIWSTRPYRLAFNKVHLLELWGFGLPIIITGVLKYLSKESDKTIVIHFIGLDNLASYFLTVLVLTGIMTLITVSLSKIFIRRISIQNDKSLQAKCAAQNGIIFLYVSLPVIAIIVLSGEVVISLLFGDTYQPIIYLVPVMAFLVSLRSVNDWLSQTIIASDKTTKILIANFFGIIGLMLAILSGYFYKGILLIIAGYCIGELISFTVLCFLINQSFKKFYLACLKILAVSLFTIFLLFICYVLMMNAQDLNKIFCAAITASFIALLFNLCSITCRKQTIEVINFLCDIFHKNKK